MTAHEFVVGQVWFSNTGSVLMQILRIVLTFSHKRHILSNHVISPRFSSLLMFCVYPVRLVDVGHLGPIVW